MKKLLLCVLGCALLLYIGCGKGQRASIIGSVYFSWNYYYDSLTKECYIEGYKYNGFNAIPLITINTDTLPLDYSAFSPTGFEYEGSITNLDDGDECKLKVDYGEGKGEATDTVPGEFKITKPDTNTVLHKGNSLLIEWESSKGAQWYWLTAYISYDYLDNNGNWEEFEYELDTMIEGTSYTISASTLFPSDVDSVLWGDGIVHVEAVNGPKSEPGVKGNIKGNAVGFFWCAYAPKFVWFSVEQLAQRPKEDYGAQIRKRHLEALKEFAAANE